nr:ribonuclease H-like domain-containing protein [Tanacetum cinerariifolium]
MLLIVTTTHQAFDGSWVYLCANELVELPKYHVTKHIVITENGSPDKNETDKTYKQVQDDNYRIKYIKKHLEAIRTANNNGLNVKGYFVWSFMDSFEWSSGYTSRFVRGVDVDETFSLVVKSGTIRTVLSLAASRYWPIHQLDVKNDFLHGDLSETVYMHQPLGFRDYVHPDYQSIRSLHLECAMTDLGPLNYFLDISVTRESSGLFLSQKKYANEILDRAHMDNCNPSRTPIDTESKLGSDGDSVSDPTQYRSLIGYCIFLGNNLLSWSSKRQPTLSRSSVEAKYRGVANDVAETCWLPNLLRELHTLLSSATLVYYDNVSAIYLSCNPVQHQRTKHIEIDIHFVRDLVVVGQVCVLHVPSRYQFADVFIKGLPSTLFEEFRTSLSVRYPPALTAGEC